jgi:hypothetical protein
MMSPSTASEATNGVEIIVGEAQNITIQRGQTTLAQMIEMTPEGITLQCGSTPTSPKIEMTPEGITLSAGGGTSCITLDVNGMVVIEGLTVRINGDTVVAINS